jgi:hypothetical protein
VTQRDTTTRRTVVGNISLSLDGRVTGRGGDSDMSWVAQHAISNASREFMVRVTSPATTALLGRKNYQGFGGPPEHHALSRGGRWRRPPCSRTGYLHRRGDSPTCRRPRPAAISLLYDRVREAG